MAGVNRDIIRKNAQALELFIRVSPPASAFLHDVHAAGDSRLLFSYEQDMNAHPDIGAAAQCEAHMMKLAARLPIDPPPRDPPEDHLGLYYDINLADPRMKELLLATAAEAINAERHKNSGFTLCCFPTGKDIHKGRIPDDYAGLKDKKKLQNMLARPFDNDVTVTDLEPLMDQMAFLPSLFRERGKPAEPRKGR